MLSTTSIAAALMAAPLFAQAVVVTELAPQVTKVQTDAKTPGDSGAIRTHAVCVSATCPRAAVRASGHTGTGLAVTDAEVILDGLHARAAFDQTSALRLAARLSTVLSRVPAG